MKIYGISGLGADKRVFDYLQLDLELIPIDWIAANKNESIKAYALRLSNAIDSQQDFALLGVSFGGLIATEISLILNPSITLLISSVQTKNELRTIFRWFGKTKLIKIIPTFLFDPPRLIAKYLFGAVNNELLNTILDDTDLGFVKWALNELICWKNEVTIQPLLKINGSNDKLIPPKGGTPIALIDGGGHCMIVDRANEVSTIINDRLKDITPRNKKL